MATSLICITHIGAIERGEKNWSIDTLVKVAGGLNVTVNDLLALPSKPEDIRNLKKTIIAEINESSPEALTHLLQLIKKSSVISDRCLP